MTGSFMSEEDKQLANLRDVLLGKEQHIVTDKIKQQSRQMVSDVLTEALHDRQNKDGSIDKVLQPFVESAVQQSVSSQSDKLINSLYPLVGGLVRKAVSAFLTDFIEKTNELLENSFTIKGIKWRFKAKQAGISFAQYAASQTFVYRVEHLLLIHRDTGLLLKSLDYNMREQADGDLISAMLTAIGDFVADSFNPGEDGHEEHLQTVSTDSFTLLIKPGPHAVLVAAVTGNPPQQVNNQLQQTLEDIHHLYNSDLIAFEGDAKPFENTETQLRDCFLLEQKQIEASSNTKKYWKAYLLLFVLCCGMTYWTTLWWQTQQLLQQVRKISQAPGIILNRIDMPNKNHLTLDILRDPDAISVSQWLMEKGVHIKHVNLTEHAFHSLAAPLIVKRIRTIMSKYPNISHDWQHDTLHLHGSWYEYEQQKLHQQLAALPFDIEQKLNSESMIKNTFDADYSKSKQLKNQQFIKYIGRIAAIKIGFHVGQSTLMQSADSELTQLIYYLRYIEQLAIELNYEYTLLIIGSSDNAGKRITNEKLSFERANSTKQALVSLGGNTDSMYAASIGQLDLINTQPAARSVLFNIVYVDNDDVLQKDAIK